jgi:NitT/TauT family transport system permease protein
MDDDHGSARRPNRYRLALLVLSLALWEALSGRILDPFFFSSPSLIGKSLMAMAQGGRLAEHLAVTLHETLVGYVYGAVAGVAFGLALGLSRFVAVVLAPYILALYSIPKITLAPLFVLWFGIGVASKIFMAFTLVFFLVFYNTYAGVQSASPELIHAIRVMGASRRQLLLKVVLPSSYPFIFVGLRTALPYALIGAVVGEFIIANRGLGYLISNAAGLFDTNGVFAGILLLTVISLALDWGLKWIERRALRWRPQGFA